jgi:hypothetical protein
LGFFETPTFAYCSLWFSVETISTLRIPLRARATPLFRPGSSPWFVFMLYFKAVRALDLVSHQEPLTMEWTTPQHEEIDLNCEISSYANAEL